MLLGRLFKKNETVNPGKLPVHIAIIPDGNGRWAKKRGLPRNVGHREGANVFKKVAKYCNKLGIKYLTLYAFSTENWSRPKPEVEGLMALLLEMLRSTDKELKGENIRIKVIGDVARLGGELQREIRRVVDNTGSNTGLTVVFALNYGGRDELLHGVKSLIKDFMQGKLKLSEINEAEFSKKLYTSDIPDPDLLIRTSGEKRISNFLLWQLAYTEFWFTDVLWPDFQEKQVMEAIKVYQSRHRRFGGV